MTQTANWTRVNITNPNAYAGYVVCNPSGKVTWTFAMYNFMEGWTLSQVEAWCASKGFLYTLTSVLPNNGFNTEFGPMTFEGQQMDGQNGF
jgi:hypothetical protein